MRRRTHITGSKEENYAKKRADAAETNKRDSEDGKYGKEQCNLSGGSRRRLV